MPLPRADAVALIARLGLGWSTLDEDGHERPVPIRRDRNGRDARKPARDFADIPTVEAAMARFDGTPESIGRPLSHLVTELEDAVRRDTTQHRRADGEDDAIAGVAARASARAPSWSRTPGEDDEE